ncbi:MAG: ATP-dependent Clp protease ATP-binding subunit ClpX, partial [Clostridia bacterium]|nr:ATP-dependent Clp protease ATP-binding subunit ClpX [Clostridia bacterium]
LADDLLSKLEPQDLLKFGLIPEFIGRVPSVVTLQALDKEALKRILTEPKNALVKQYQKLLAYDDVELEFEDDAIDAITSVAMARKTGARGLRAIIENVMTDVMFNVPSIDNVTKCIVTKDTVENGAQPILVYADAKKKKTKSKKADVNQNEGAGA